MVPPESDEAVVAARTPVPSLPDALADETSCLTAAKVPDPAEMAAESWAAVVVATPAASVARLKVMLVPLTVAESAVLVPETA